MGQRCIEAEILAQAIVRKTFKFIEKINDSNKDDEDFKNFSKKENQIKDCILYIYLINAFKIKGNYNYKSDNKLVIEIIKNLEYDFDKLGSTTCYMTDIANKLTKKNIFIKKIKIDDRSGQIDYFKLNKDYIEKLENELRSEECK